MMDWFINLFNSTSLQILLLVGSGILAISLLVLALTRWGQSRPVWKCVILSFVAHILLMGYAYGTRLIFDTPAPIVKNDNAMRVNLIKEVGKSLDGEDSTDSTDQPWDQFVNDQPLPDLDELHRPQVDSEVVIERKIDRSVEKPAAVSIDPQMKPIPQAFEAAEFSPRPETVLDAPPIDVATQPAEIEVKRRGDNSFQPDQPKFDSIAEMDRPELNKEFRPEFIRPDVEKPKSDNSFVSELIDQNSQFSISSSSIPEPAAAPDLTPARALPKPSANNQLRVVSSPRRIADGQPLPKIYSLRSVQNRLEVAKRRGGSIETERAVELSLNWLAKNQEGDGRWDSNKTGGGKETKVFGHNRGGAGTQADCGISGLATLAFLAAGHTHYEGRYQSNVRRGLEFLAQQQRSDGDLSGDARMFARMYCHSMSLLALSEALAMTGDQRLLPVVQKGVDYSLYCQNRNDGGWRYQPGDAGDMSQFGWQVLALYSAKLGGAKVPAEAFQRMERFIDTCSSGVGKGLASYRPNHAPSTTMTAEALLCRFILQDRVGQETITEATRNLAQELPTPEEVNLYYWYYGTLAMYHSGGEDWRSWNEDLKRTLLGLQINHGNEIGSWSPNTVWGGYGGRVYSTAMATLNLEVYYRYLPLYQQLADGAALQKIKKR